LLEIYIVSQGVNVKNVLSASLFNRA